MEIKDISTPTGLSYSGDRTLSDSEVDTILKYVDNLEEVSSIVYFNPDGSNMLYTQKYVEEKDKEIQRLNNIIDELEKYLEEKRCYEDLVILDKLKELKEGKK